MFTNKFILLWKIDRDGQWAEVGKGEEISAMENALCKSLDTIFESCDCFHPEPEGQFEIGGDQLWKKVRQVFAKQWGEI